MIHLFVPGIPKGQPRPRAFATKQGKARVYEAGTAEAWKGAVALAIGPRIQSKPPITGPVKLRVTFLLPRPKRLMRKIDPEGPVLHTAKPDTDNLAKAVMDAMTQIGVWVDDTQVCKLEAVKAYHEKSGRPGAWIQIEELEE